jgi:hypothetical protein
MTLAASRRPAASLVGEQPSEQSNIREFVHRLLHQPVGPLLRLALSPTWAARRQALADLRKAQVRRYYARKVDRFYANVKRIGASGTIDTATLDQHLRKWSQLQKRVNPKWYMVYTLTSGINCVNYVPTDFYVLYIEPALNDLRLAPCFTNKGTYHLLFDPDLFPENLINNINGVFYDGDSKFVKPHDVMGLLSECDRVVVKPSIDSGGAKDVQVFSKFGSKHRNRHGDELTMEYLAEHYGRDFVVQKYIEQLDYFKQLNETSVNSVRVYTYRSVRTDKISVENIVVRIGSAGSEVDNFRAGGVTCKIDKDGRFGTLAVDEMCGRHTHLPGSGTRFADLPPVPQIDDICKAAITIAEKLSNQRVIGFDVCIDSKGKIKIIEINTCGVGINVHQFTNGGLFHDHTDEIIEFCKQSARSASMYKSHRCIYL